MELTEASKFFIFWQLFILLIVFPAGLFEIYYAPVDHKVRNIFMSISTIFPGLYFFIVYFKGGDT